VLLREFGTPTAAWPGPFRPSGGENALSLLWQAAGADHRLLGPGQLVCWLALVQVAAPISCAMGGWDELFDEGDSPHATEVVESAMQTEEEISGVAAAMADSQPLDAAQAEVARLRQAHAGLLEAHTQGACRWHTVPLQ
jgi:hypothetical protein